VVFTGSSHRGWAGALRRLQAAVGGAVLAVGLMASSPAVTARESQQQAAPTSPVALSTLPAEAQTTYQAIRNGGPFRFSKDGTVFGNRERILPRKARGFYREYTVRTPGSRDRGARRIVCGGAVPTEPDACYYTDDHYASFRLIAQ
jgi:ribonuclease T1